MNYQGTLNLLAERGNEVRGMHLGLHRIAAVMRALGDPHREYSVLHIAGTNGKGSVAAMAEEILRAGGWKTGLYTSPHLVRLQERIRVSGRNISTRKFAAAATRIASVEADLFDRGRLDIRLTYFEFLTACAFLHFASDKVDVAVIEVGLGGRLDATNVVAPQACIITGISADHQDVLGTTLEQIASEKAGIVKKGVPLVSGCRAQEAARVVRLKARRVGAALTEIDRDCRIRVLGERGARLILDLKTRHRTYRNLRLSLAGVHQARNAALAVAGVEALEAFPVKEEDVRRGLARTRWPGRLEEHRSRRRTLLDGAHNLEGARALRNYLTRWTDVEIHFVFGALQEKDITRMGAVLFPLGRSIHLAPVANSRTADPASVAAANSRFRPRMRIHRDAHAALQAAWDECPAEGLVVVCGSLYLVGELLPVVRSQGKTLSAHRGARPSKGAGQKP